MVENTNIPSLGAGQTNRVQSLEQKKYKAAAMESSEHPSASDKATVSVEAQLLAKSVTALNGMEDVRQEKVAAIKREIESGTYSIKYEQIAARIENVLNQIAD